ncbi:MAG: tRNA (guanosine(37)-N1)-methyltransferase TrmD [Pseudomonadota bacterium]
MSEEPPRRAQRTLPTRSHGRLSIEASSTPRDLTAEATVKGAWRATVLTLFPGMFPGPLGASLLGKALQDGLWALETVDLRAHGLGKHRTVDGPPAGGGPGMVLRADVVDAALAARPRPGPAFYLSPRGRPMTQGLMRALAEGPGVTLLCGRFEGVDQRVLEARGLEELSLGDFVMTGGEIAAMALIDATVRLIPRVLGNAGSVEDESFSHGLLEAPHYTKPAEWNGRAIPEVLLSGHHAEIDRWRREQAERLTKDRRPELWRALSDAEGSSPEGELERSGGNENAGAHVPPRKGRPK